jgi:hypothetical protein
MKPTARLHKLLAKDESYQIGGLRLPSGDFTASDQEVVDHLLETQFSCLSANYRGSFKSAGEDGIFPALLKNWIEILSGPLVKIFTACLALGYIPEVW